MGPDSARSKVSKDDMMRLLWPYAATEDMDYMCMVFDLCRLEEVTILFALAAGIEQILHDHQAEYHRRSATKATAPQTPHRAIEMFSRNGQLPGSGLKHL